MHQFVLVLMACIFSQVVWAVTPSHTSKNTAKKNEALPDIVVRTIEKRIFVYSLEGGNYLIQECQKDKPVKTHKDCVKIGDTVVIPQGTFEMALMDRVFFLSSGKINLELKDRLAIAGGKKDKESFEAIKHLMTAELKDLREYIKIFGDGKDKEDRRKLERLEAELKNIEKNVRSVEIANEKYDEAIESLRYEQKKWRATMRQYSTVVANLIKNRYSHVADAFSSEKNSAHNVEILEHLYVRPPIPCGAKGMTVADAQKDCKSKLREKAFLTANGKKWSLVRVSDLGVQYWRDDETGMIWSDPSPEAFMYQELGGYCEEPFQIPTSSEMKVAIQNGYLATYPGLSKKPALWVKPSSGETWQGGDKAFRLSRNPSLETIDKSETAFFRASCVMPGPLDATLAL